jgi:ribosomal protein L28
VVDGQVRNVRVCTRCLHAGKVQKAVRRAHKSAVA